MSGECEDCGEDCFSCKCFDDIKTPQGKSVKYRILFMEEPQINVNQRRKSRWINAKERLPFPGERVLVFVKDAYLACEYVEYQRNGEKSNFFDVLNGGSIAANQTEVIHWMPLPEPPNENH